MTAVNSRILRDPGDGLGAGVTSLVRNLVRNKVLLGDIVLVEQPTEERDWSHAYAMNF